MDKNKALELDKKKRNIIATKRICFVLGICNVLLIAYIIIQVILLGKN